jgi:hypothetical protein
MTAAAKYILLAVVVVALSNCGEGTDKGRISTDLINISATANSSDISSNKSGPMLKMDDISFNFGTIAAGKRVNHVFKFVNSGDSPLLLANVHATCGCTVAKSWPKDPIMTGQGGEIVVEFDSSNMTGHQDNAIHIVSNARPASLVLKLTGDVIGPDFELSDITSN